MGAFLCVAPWGSITCLKFQDLGKIADDWQQACRLPALSGRIMQVAAVILRGARAARDEGRTMEGDASEAEKAVTVYINTGTPTTINSEPMIVAIPMTWM
jgi:hypothetical protein